MNFPLSRTERSKPRFLVAAVVTLVVGAGLSVAGLTAAQAATGSVSCSPGAAITDPNSDETFQQRFTCTNTKGGNVHTTPAQGYEPLGVIKAGTNFFACCSSTNDRTKSGGYYQLLTDSDAAFLGSKVPFGTGWGWVSSEVIGAKPNDLSTITNFGIKDCGVNSGKVKPAVESASSVSAVAKTSGVAPASSKSAASGRTKKHRQ